MGPENGMLSGIEKVRIRSCEYSISALGGPVPAGAVRAEGGNSAGSNPEVVTGEEESRGDPVGSHHPAGRHEVSPSGGEFRGEFFVIGGDGHPQVQTVRIGKSAHEFILETKPCPAPQIVGRRRTDREHPHWPDARMADQSRAAGDSSYTVWSSVR